MELMEQQPKHSPASRADFALGEVLRAPGTLAQRPQQRGQSLGHLLQPSVTQLPQAAGFNQEGEKEES